MSRNFATLDDSDVLPDTYQGFDKCFVIDLRGTVQVACQLAFAICVDTVNNDRYFLFCSFSQQSVTVSLQWRP